MATTVTFDRIQAHSVKEIREGHAQRGDGKHIRCIEYGDGAKRVTATGRARCRACGSKILKGQSALAFPWDFRGGGSWTVVHVQIHESATDCQGAK